MCGIIGYIGKSEATGILIEGLKNLEYRGYDSGGIAVMGNKLNVIKAKGEINNLEKKLKSTLPVGKLGIGHTRWATHGSANEINAHPQLSEHFAVVHNGIIENFAEIKDSLTMSGVTFDSETDTEVIPKLLEMNYSGDVLDAIKKTVKLLQGSWALGIVCTDEPNVLYCTKNGSPLIIGKGEDENFIASDINAIVAHTHDVIYLEDYETAKITKNDILIYNKEFSVLNKEITKINSKTKQADKAGYKHYMLKEIYEQSDVVNKTLMSVTKDGDVYFDAFPYDDEDLKHLQRIYIIGCGSAYNVGLIAKYNFEKIARIPTFAEFAGEFRYEDTVLDENCLVILVSQSGETADTLAALKKAKSEKTKTISIVNVAESSISKMSDYNIQTLAGTEVAVATTKAFSCQLAVLNMLCLYIALHRGACSEVFSEITVNMSFMLPKKYEQIFAMDDEIRVLAGEIKNMDKCFFLGKNVDYGASLEGALKLKEISYIDCTGYPASELKHGTISLIEKGTVCIGLISSNDILSKTIASLDEVVARGATVIVFAPKSMAEALSKFDKVITYPDSIPLLNVQLEVILLQLLAYHVADEKGLSIDKPRNLAKSVTVE